jgi:LmbE family N-acetylglucosaminyl deacetylase
MKRLVTIFAHPDDESMIAGTMAHYVRDGGHVALICTTKGEAGEISDESLALPENLGSVRENELRCACDVIGVQELHLLGYCDSGMDGTPENDKATAFIQADPDEVRLKLVRLFRSIRPQVVITFEPLGWYGHPDHIAASQYATESYYLSGDPNAFPEAGPAWEPSRLYHAAFRRSDFKVIVDYIHEQGIENSDFDLLSWDEPDPLEGKITHLFDASEYLEIKEEAMRCHKTQFGEDNIIQKLPREIWQQASGSEYFVQVEPSPESSTSSNDDLFAGISLEKHPAFSGRRR